MLAADLFDNDLTPDHVLGKTETLRLEEIAQEILKKVDTTRLSVPYLEEYKSRDSLGEAIEVAFLEVNHYIEEDYQPPHALLDVFGSQIRENHPLHVFEDMGLIPEEVLLEYQLVMGQLVESIERLVYKGNAIMGKKSTTADLFDPPSSTNEREQVKIMKNSERGIQLLRENRISKRHSVLSVLPKVSSPLKSAYASYQKRVSTAWSAFVEHEQQESDRGFDSFMQDYQGDLDRAVKCLKIAYAMTNGLLLAVQDDEILTAAQTSMKVFLNPVEYKRAYRRGIKHLANVNEVLTPYVQMDRVVH